MKTITKEQRATILGYLLEGISMRSVSRRTGVSINTVGKLVKDAGLACIDYHDRTVRNVHGSTIECDEIWAFVKMRDKHLNVVDSSNGAGTAWTWKALDRKSRLIVSWYVSNQRRTKEAREFVGDLASRLSNRVQIFTDGLLAYPDAMAYAFGDNVDYAQIVKTWDKEKCTGVEKVPVIGNPDLKTAGTSYVERANMTTRMSVRRFTRETNAFSKKLDFHRYMLAIYFVYYNFCRVHRSLGKTPAVEAGLTDTIYPIAWIGELIDKAQPEYKPRGRYQSKRQAYWDKVAAGELV